MYDIFIQTIPQSSLIWQMSSLVFKKPDLIKLFFEAFFRILLTEKHNPT